MKKTHLPDKLFNEAFDNYIVSGNDNDWIKLQSKLAKRAKFKLACKLTAWVSISAIGISVAYFALQTWHTDNSIHTDSTTEIQSESVKPAYIQPVENKTYKGANPDILQQSKEENLLHVTKDVLPPAYSTKDSLVHLQANLVEVEKSESQNNDTVTHTKQPIIKRITIIKNETVVVHDTVQINK